MVNSFNNRKIIKRKVLIIYILYIYSRPCILNFKTQIPKSLLIHVVLIVMESCKNVLNLNLNEMNLLLSRNYNITQRQTG